MRVLQDWSIHGMPGLHHVVHKVRRTRGLLHSKFYYLQCIFKIYSGFTNGIWSSGNIWDVSLHTCNEVSLTSHVQGDLSNEEALVVYADMTSRMKAFNEAQESTEESWGSVIQTIFGAENLFKLVVWKYLLLLFEFEISIFVEFCYS